MVDHFSPTNLLAIGLATASLLAVLVRLVLTFGDNVQMLRVSQEEALTDPLTGLFNRRKLTLDLARDLEATTDDGRFALALFDLDGFKQYNDTFGHPAGDALLMRLGRKLAGQSASGPAPTAWAETSSACWPSSVRTAGSGWSTTPPLR